MLKKNYKGKRYILEKDKEKYRLKIFLVKDEFVDKDLLKQWGKNIGNFYICI